MRRLLRVALWTVAAGSFALSAAWLPDALAELDTFRAREYKVVGARLLNEEQLLAAAAIPPFISVFDDLTEIERRLELHPMVRRARVSARLPRTLVVTVEERVPVGFVANPVLEPVDREGHVLPLDPAYHRMDLPVLFRAGGGPALSSSQLKVLTLEVERLGGDDPTFLAAVSEMAIDDRGDATALVGGDLLFRFRPPLSHSRLRDGLTVLEDAARQRPDRRVAVLDLRFEDQIVLRYGRAAAPSQARGDD